jgi:hypothetical protein
MDLLKSYHGEFWKLTLRNIKHLMLHLGKKPLIKPENVGSIKCHVTMARGENDKMVSFEETLNIQNCIPNSNYIELLDTKHPIEQLEIKNLDLIIKETNLV